jgi:succinate-semialdehyde dehydrogenase/glutarate-semialdehyde dehydrogenase
MPFLAVNPTTEEVLASYPAHSASEIDRRVAVAHAAFGRWRRVPVAERAMYLRRCAELLEAESPDIAQLMTAEMGKTFASAKGEVAKCAALVRHYAEHAPAMLETASIPTSGSSSGVRYEPLGALLAVMPWNYPLWQVFRVLGPNLMAGNVVVVKHAPNVPGCATLIEDLWHRSGLFAGCVTNLFAELDDVARVVGDSRIAGVTLTGSERAGRAIGALAGRHLKKCVLELGGSDAFIVAGSADLARTVDEAVTARVQNNGQSCIAAKRFIVVRPRAEEFLERFSAAMTAVPVGDPMDPATALGPLATRSQLDLLDDQVRSSLDAGATLRAGGAAPGGRGYYFPATVLSDAPADSRAAREELFGPVAVVHVVADLAGAITLANATPFGLGASIWAQDDDEVEAAIVGINVGMVFANTIVASMAELPFGGTKNSGLGRELGDYGVREFSNVKAFYVA